MTWYISNISSYCRSIVSSIGSNSSRMVDFPFMVLEFYNDNRWFSTTRCSTYFFITTSSFLNLAFSFNKHFEFSYATMENATFVAMIALRFLLVLEVITFSVATETRFWGSFGKYLCL